MLALSCYGHEPTLLRDSPASDSLSLDTLSSGTGAQEPAKSIYYRCCILWLLKILNYLNESHIYRACTIKKGTVK